MDERDAIGLAQAVVERYQTVPGLRMAVITGSFARGLADDSSDLDVYLYWDTVDVGALTDRHRLDGLGARRPVGLQTATGCFEKYVVGERYLDVESVDTDVLAAVAAALASGTDRLPIRFWERVRTGLLEPSVQAMRDLDDLLAEILDIVDENVAGSDTRTARFVLSLRPTAAPS